jgi:hypothetical protein
VFTAGAPPFDRGSFDVFLGGWAPTIREAGLEPKELLRALAAATRTLLEGRTRDVNELRDALLGSVGLGLGSNGRGTPATACPSVCIERLGWPALPAS